MLDYYGKNKKEKNKSRRKLELLSAMPSGLLTQEISSDEAETFCSPKTNLKQMKESVGFDCLDTPVNPQKDARISRKHKVYKDSSQDIKPTLDKTFQDQKGLCDKKDCFDDSDDSLPDLILKRRAFRKSVDVGSFDLCLAGTSKIETTSNKYDASTSEEKERACTSRKEQVSKKQKWGCTTCTYLNHDTMNACEMCFTPKNKKYTRFVKFSRLVSITGYK